MGVSAGVCAQHAWVLRAVQFSGNGSQRTYECRHFDQTSTWHDLEEAGHRRPVFGSLD